MTSAIDRKKRFDETFRTLLVVVTVTLTFSLNFLKESLKFTFFMNIYGFFMISVILWAFVNITNGRYEYLLKLLAWHFLIFDLVISLTRITFSEFLTSKIAGFTVGTAILFLILYPTWWISAWLRDAKVIPAQLSRNLLYAISIWTVFQVALMWV